MSGFNNIGGIGYGNDDLYNYNLNQAAQQITAGNIPQTNNYANTQAFQGRTQPAADTFERQSSGPDFGTAATVTGLTGLGAAGAGYKWYSNPVGADGKLADGFQKHFANEYSNIVRSNAIEEVYKRNGKVTQEILDEIKTVSEGGEIKDLSEEAKKFARKNGIGNKQSAENFVKKIENEIGQKVNPGDIVYQTKRLEALESVQKELGNLPDAKKATLEKFIVEHPEEFGLKGKTEKQLQKEARKLMSQFTPSAKVEELLTSNAKALGIDAVDKVKVDEAVKEILENNSSKEEIGKYLKKNAKKLGLVDASGKADQAAIDAIASKNKNEIKKFLKTNASKLGIEAVDETKIAEGIEKILKEKNTPAKLEAYIKTNADKLGIKGTPAEIAAKAKKLAATGNGQKTVERLLAAKIKGQQANVKSAESVYTSVAKLWNKDKNIFNKSGNKAIASATENGLKKFKWGKAGKVGAIAAGIALVGTWLLGGSKQSA